MTDGSGVGTRAISYPVTDEYISVSDATTYFGSTKHLYADAWSDATTDEKTAALNMAQQKIESIRWKGRKYSEDQDLQWPRYVKVKNVWKIAVYDETTEAAIVPPFITDAVCEEALEILRTGNSQRRRMQKAGLSEFWLSSEVKEKYNSNGSIKDTGLISWEAYNLVKNWIGGPVVIR